VTGQAHAYGASRQAKRTATALLPRAGALRRRGARRATSPMRRTAGRFCLQN